MSNFSERLNFLREESGKKQIQVAEELGITPQNMSYYFNGREPSFDTLVGIADYFGVTVDYLIGKSDFKTFQHELDYKNRVGNEQSIKAFPQGEKALLSINEHFSEILKDIVSSDDGNFISYALAAFNQLLVSIRYVKLTLKESFSDMKFYIDFLKVLKQSEEPLSMSIMSALNKIEIDQPQIAGCKKRLNEFLSLYIYSIFDFDKMSLKTVNPEGKE